jgi:hypothetical protein
MATLSTPNVQLRLRNRPKRLVVTLLLAAMLFLACPRSGQARCVDVGLVLAIDASGSISAVDFMLQIQGYRRALTSPGVVSSFSLAGTVDIAAIFWADSAFTPQVIPWHRIASAEDAHRFADELASTKRLVSGNTDIGSGLMAAIDLFDAAGQCADRKIIDLSGDGRASVTARRGDRNSVVSARRRAEELGITINALAITTQEPKLADYYRRAVTTGPSSFVMEVGDFDGFKQAITQKLMRELLSGIDQRSECSMRAPAAANPACTLIE